MIAFVLVLDVASYAGGLYVLKAFSPGHGPLWSPLSKFGAWKACLPVTVWDQRHHGCILAASHTVDRCGHWGK
jgi:hypothetical protein